MIVLGDDLSEDHARRLKRVRIAQEFGWTLDYVDSLSLADVNDVMAIITAQNKAKEYQAKKAQEKARSKKWRR